MASSLFWFQQNFFSIKPAGTHGICVLCELRVSGRCMKITENNFTVTTIYFDGQFWSALIEQCRDGKNYAGRFVFGAEPSNPQILNWMAYDFANVPLFPVEGRKIRFKKLAKSETKSKAGGGIPKALKAFSEAQKAWMRERKKQNRKQRKLEEKQKYLDKRGRHK